MPSTDIEVVQVAMGGLEVHGAPKILTTLLGSCVGLVIQDHHIKIGAIAHVVRPSGSMNGVGPGYFADQAVVRAKELLLQAGAKSNHLTVRLAGGSNMFDSDREDTIGAQNISALKQATYDHGMIYGGQVLAEGKGSILILDLSTGRMHVEGLLSGTDAANGVRARRKIIQRFIARIRR